MIVSSKDGVKLVGISVVCFCAVFVCTFMLNFYLDVIPLRNEVPEEFLPLYKAQLATAQFTSAITGGVLGLTALAMLLFYLRIFIENKAKQLGVLKALGYSRGAIAARFWVFGLSVFTGCAAGHALGWAFMRLIYDGLTIEGMDKILPAFHVGLLFALVFAPTALFSAIACAYPYFLLRRPAAELLRGAEKQPKAKARSDKKERPFLWVSCVSALSSKKLLAFFFAFSCFCFAAMTQMGLSMDELTDATMGYIILIIGLVLAAVTAFLSITALIRANRKNIALMKAFGYSLAKCTLAVLGGYLPFTLLGFALGTVYQYGLLSLMINIVFANVADVPAYSFSVPAFFLTLAAFLITYGAVTLRYVLKIKRVSVKEIMLEK